MMSKGELQDKLRAQLEACVRDRMATLAEKKQALEGFKDALDSIDTRQQAILDELDGCVQQSLPFKEGGEEE